MTTSKRLVNGMLALAVPFVLQSIIVIGFGTFWPRAWDWMNALPTVWAMAVILGPSLAVGLFFLYRAFGWYSSLLAVVYLPVMLIVVSNWVGYITDRLDIVTH